jgi:hypothetical protein
MIFKNAGHPSFRIMHCLSASADSLGAFTCLGGAAATGKLPRDIST